MPEGVNKNVGLRTRALHETENRLDQTDCSNAFNPVNGTAVLAEVVTCAPALTLFVIECYVERRVIVLF